MTGERWAQIEEVGTPAGLRAVSSIARRMPRPAALAFVQLIAAYYTLRNGRARRSSREYLARVWSNPQGRDNLGHPPSLRLVFQHIREFAVSLYDRLMVWSKALEGVEIDDDGAHEIFSLTRSGVGALLFGAHLGSAEMLWLISKRYDLPVNVVAFFDNARRINAFIESLDAEARVRVIEIDPQSVRAAFEIRACLQRGEIVVILADRLPPGHDARSAEVSFLGERARFPFSPFLLASNLGCRTYFTVCLRTGDARYRTVLRRLSEGARIERDGREAHARELLARFAEQLERFCLEYPLQWFNFFDFWSREPER